MKKILLGAALCLSITTLQAQSLSLHVNQFSSNRLTVVPTVQGMTSKADMKASILSVDLVGSFDVFGDMPGSLLRFGLGYTSMSIDGKANADYGGDEYDKTDFNLKQNTIRIAPGLAKNLAGNDNYSFYAGIDLPVSVIGSTSFEADNEGRHMFDSTLETTKSRVEGTMDGGLGIGLSPLIGFSYSGKSPFAIGMELASGLQYTKIGPDASVKYFEDGTLQGDGSADISSSSISKMPPRISITLSYKLGKKTE
jgi:hypothetical protein